MISVQWNGQFTVWDGMEFFGSPSRLKGNDGTAEVQGGGALVAVYLGCRVCITWLGLQVHLPGETLTLQPGWA